MKPSDPLLPDRTPRAARAASYTAAYYLWLGGAPDVHTADEAKRFHQKIRRILEDRERFPLLRSERQRLWRIEKRWKRRAEGKDHRWLHFGSRAGRLEKHIEAELRPKPHPDWRS